MGRWRDLVRAEIRKITSEAGTDLFSRQALIKRGLSRFQKEFPSAKTPEQTLSRELQALRETGEIEFSSRGLYRVLLRSATEIRELEDDPGRPIILAGERKVALRQVASRPFQLRLRAQVLPNFGLACAICRLAPEWFLEAAHLRPVTDFIDLAGDPGAALALCRNHHVAMDEGAITIERDLQITVNKDRFEATPPETKRILFAYDRKKIAAPKRYPLNKAALPSIPVRHRRRGIKTTP